MDYEIFGLIVLIIINIPLGLIPAYILKNKGDKEGFYKWWFLGWAFFGIMLPYSIIVKEKWSGLVKTIVFIIIFLALLIPSILSYNSNTRIIGNSIYYIDLGIISLLGLFRSRDFIEVEESVINNQSLRYCPFCGKEIIEDAVVCIYCGRQIKPLKQSKTNMKWSNIIMAILVILAIIIPFVGIITGIIGLTQNEKHGQGLTLLIIGIISFLIWGSYYYSMFFSQIEGY